MWWASSPRASELASSTSSANEQEFARTTTDTRIDERTLREVYLRPFEAVVTEAQARGVMAAYNYVNGEHACSNQALLRDVLKDEWDFDGLVLSDWNAMKETVAPAQAGLDVEMPGPGRYWGAGQLAASVEVGEVDLDQLDDKVAARPRVPRVAGTSSWSERH